MLGWPGEAVTLDLDHERFAYAGKFVMSRTGKAVVREDDGILGAVAFDADRTDESVCRLRYVTVRAGRRGEGIGSRLLAFVRARVVAAGEYEAVEIAVNNPFAYDAAYRAGFGYTGRETGIAELVLAWPRPPEDPDRSDVPDDTSGRIEDRSAVPEDTSGRIDDGSDVPENRSERPQDRSSGPGGESRGGDERSGAGYRAGLEIYAARSLSPPERAFVEDALKRGPPDPVAVPGQ